jgi:hypothetical protein
MTATEEEHVCTIFYYYKLDNGDRFLLCSECDRITLMSTMKIEDKVYNLKEYSDDVLRDSV